MCRYVAAHQLDVRGPNVDWDGTFMNARSFAMNLASGALRTLVVVYAFAAFAALGCGDDEPPQDDGPRPDDACNAVSCNGCCDDFGNCLAGSAVEACGVNGASCVGCPTRQACSIAGRCVICDATVCDGCCDENGSCQPGNRPDACGAGGGACVTCDFADHCYELDVQTRYCSSV